MCRVKVLVGGRILTVVQGRHFYGGMWHVAGRCCIRGGTSTVACGMWCVFVKGGTSTVACGICCIRAALRRWHVACGMCCTRVALLRWQVACGMWHVLTILPQADDAAVTSHCFCVANKTWVSQTQGQGRPVNRHDLSHQLAISRTNT